MAEAKRVIVTGATGLIGQALCTQLQERGYSIVVFSRDPEAARRGVPGASDYVAWQAEESGPWAAALEGAYAVVNLAGASIGGKRWSESYKRVLRESRVLGTRGLVRAMAQARSRPEVLLNASAIGFYGDRGAEPLDESAGPGYDFLALLAQEWEGEARKAEELGVRTVMARNGIVLDRQAEAMRRLLLPFKLFVGGPILPGTQYWSWVHLADVLGLLLMALEDERVRGPLNVVAPQATTNREFSNTLARVLRRPALFPVPGFALKLLLGEFAEVALIAGQRVVPAKAQELGYQFKYPSLEGALREIVG